MSEIATDAGATSPDALYGAEYYHSHCGDEPYTADSAVWQEFYGRIADEIVRSLTPQRVFDAGCAVGFLVAALWDRNVEAHGRDISSYAISEVRADVREYCAVGSITDPIEGDFDVVLCIEVLEHMPEDEAIAAIATMTRAAPRILFSSTPSDFEEPTHVNVRPTLYWLRQFAAAGFAPVVQYDASYVIPHAMLLERTADAEARDLAAFAEVVRQRLARATEAQRTAEANRQIGELHKQMSELHQLIASQHAERVAADAEWQARLTEAEHRAQQFAALATTPLRVEQLGRRVARVGWWTVTMQLPERLRARRARLSPPAQVIEGPPQSAEPPLPEGVRDVAGAIADQFPYNRPLRTYAAPSPARRLSVVTDSIAEGFLYGGVGTAVIIATLLAKRVGATLRLITRTQPADVQRLQTVLEAQGLDWPAEIDVVFAPTTDEEDIPMGAGDLFLTTSWWTTRAALQSVPAGQVIYLLQEDERMFYPRGDDRLRCSETLARTDLRMLVNSQLLYTHLAEGAEALPELAGRAQWFEPAFPSRLFHDEGQRGDRRRFLFYARPNNLRNLFWRGLEAIAAAMESGVLDPQRWSFTFVGKDIPRLSLPGGVIPETLENLPWDRYADVVRHVDLGLALMDTPHPSYPPLDLAASGAVVVTNSCGGKVSLESYSKNIIVVPPSVDELRAGLARAVSLVDDDTTRRRNYSQSGIRRDWQATLEATIERCASWVEG
jgi:2-polyprenyl-3-methyl-5-hydroxy-6-metoxy-1,4-benzoquinol methylase